MPDLTRPLTKVPNLFGHGKPAMSRKRGSALVEGPAAVPLGRRQGLASLLLKELDGKMARIPLQGLRAGMAWPGTPWRLRVDARGWANR